MPALLPSDRNVEALGRLQLFQQNFRLLQSRVSKPSVNQPYTGASSSCACCTLSCSRQRRARLMAAEFPGLCTLLACNRESKFEILFHLHRVTLGRNQSDFPGDTQYVGTRTIFPLLFLPLEWLR